MAYDVAFDYGHDEDTWEDTGGKGVRRNGKKYEEFHFNRDVGEQARKIVERHGLRVYVTQPASGERVTLNQRTYRANRRNVKAFVSFHANAGTPAADGACVFAWKTSSNANRLADNIVAQFKNAGIDLHGSGRHYSRRGHWTNFHVLRETNMPAVLIEHGFMTNKQDFKEIFGEDSREYRKKCAIADAKGVLDYFGISYDGKDNDSAGPRPVLGQGDKGNDVKLYQKKLLEAGYTMDGHGADGSFGPSTVETTEKFQKKHGLTVDGLAGPKTQAKLKQVLESKKAPEKEDNKYQTQEESDMPFKDVDENKWYADELEEAEKAGIARGLPNDTFNPDEPVTRAEAAVFALRAYKNAKK
ncbi:N-acetylmuramoyl-L-alanine amidase [Salimicrobium album]|uniref:N-acetylmuramoyl-L-alanine amidase n=1 Tax=Salimicrobium album TaxID=50717 RepID=A0A1H3DGL8_9BACI|nr:N-acetylmuramoyl-L-alanine amidase [Salimicrobium album]SDX65613.1 N-acetylmuramoyl-L-alanine amidase [Salimicrobium album]